MIDSNIGIYPTGFNTNQEIWKPIAATNLINLAGLLCKVVIPSGGTAASTTITFGAEPTDGDTMTIGGYTYRFKTSIAAIGDVLIGGSASAAATNLKDAITGTGTAGTNYYTGTPVNPLVTASVASTVVTITALQSGTGGNSITATSSNSSNVVAASPLTGGVNATSFQPTNQAAIELVASVSDYPTDILVDDGSQTGDTTVLGKFVSAAPLDALIQFRVPVVLGSGNAGDLLVLAPSPNLGSLQPLTGSATGTYNRVFQALEGYQPGQRVLVRRYYGTQT